MEFISKEEKREERRNEENDFETPLERVARMVEEGEVRFDWGD